MRMVTRIAFANMKYHRSKNILTGIAVFLTAVLLFVVPTIGMDILDVQFAMVNQTYPTWHALYRNVDTETADRLKAHRDIAEYGLRSDVGMISDEEADTAVYYMDESGLELYRMELAEGRLPSDEDEIAVSRGMLHDMGVEAEIGDTVVLPFQRFAEGGLDYTEDRTFTVCGFLPDSEASLKNHSYAALVSDSFLKREIPQDQIRYRFLFQIDSDVRTSVDAIEKSIEDIAAGFEIPETDTNVNRDYLSANYVDPVFFPAIAVIMLIIMLAGIITIYSIYYVSMAQRVREFGRLKAIGATRRQIRQIVLREGLWVAAAAIPAGLLVSTLLIKPILLFFIGHTEDEHSVLEICRKIIVEGEVPLYRWWIYLIAAAVTLAAVYCSLLIPMRKAAKISEVDAMRWQDGRIKKEKRRGYQSLTLGRLTKTNLLGNKKKSLVTILSMSITGIFVMVIATVLSCANPTESADSDSYGQYKLELNAESGNREHPEREWERIIQDNPLSEELKAQIEDLDGVEKVVEFTQLSGTTNLQYEDGEAWTEGLIGLPEECFEELEAGIVEGDADWEDLLEGDKIILNQAMLHWFPDIGLGDRIQMQIDDGSQTVTRDLEVIAIGDYRFGLTEYNYLIMSKEAADQILEQNCTGYFHVMADKTYDEKLEADIQNLISDTDLVAMDTWKAKYETWKQGMGMTQGGCYAFLSVLSIICIMNLINTMINSIHVRKKEIGMLQAIGMTGAQLSRMLRMEGMFYTLGTLLISIGAGSALGYPVFLWMKKEHWFSVSDYHYPVSAAVVIILVMVAVQLLLTAVLSRSVKKESLIDRIRFSE